MFKKVVEHREKIKELEKELKFEAEKVNAYIHEDLVVVFQKEYMLSGFKLTSSQLAKIMEDKKFAVKFFEVFTGNEEEAKKLVEWLKRWTE